MSSAGQTWSRRRFLSAIGQVAAVKELIPRSLRGVAFAQSIGTEPETIAGNLKYLTQWTGPPKASVPDWARPGKIRFARWDGGALEAAKAILSGWPEFSPIDPNYLDTMVSWYDLQTIKVLEKAHINLIWVTFSNGFSIQSERRQQKQLQQYIVECHKRGIRTIAYESLTNIFMDNMLEQEPRSKEWLQLNQAGKPIPYSAANYKCNGHATRYLADLSNEEWRLYMKKRIDLAIEAGADGIMYDNCFGPTLLDAVQEILMYALRQKGELLVMANFHREEFIYNRLLNALTTEEGGEAGILSEEKLQKANNRWRAERNTMKRVYGGYLANNLGRMRVFSNLSEGWKPFMSENRIRQTPGMAEMSIMSPNHQKLAIAENLMFNSAYEPSVEIRFAEGLWNNKPEAEEAWQAIAQYNEFAKENEEYFIGAQTKAIIAIVLDDLTDGVEILNGLAGRNLQYVILYEHQVDCAILTSYKVVALLTAKRVRDSALAALRMFVERGGKLFIAGESASLDEKGRPRVRPSWMGTNFGMGESTIWDVVPDVDVLAHYLSAADTNPAFQISTPSQVLYSIAEQREKGRTLIHFVNYSPISAGRCTVITDAQPRSIRVISPDGAAGEKSITLDKSGRMKVAIQSIVIYSILVLENSATSIETDVKIRSGKSEVAQPQ